jgi:hypothetical protein
LACFSAFDETKLFQFDLSRTQNIFCSMRVSESHGASPAEGAIDRRSRKGEWAFDFALSNSRLFIRENVHSVKRKQKE